MCGTLLAVQTWDPIVTKEPLLKGFSTHRRLVLALALDDCVRCLAFSEAYAAQRREAAEMEKEFPDQVSSKYFYYHFAGAAIVMQRRQS